MLVHGSLATGPLEWEDQRPLAGDGYELVVPTRRAYVTPDFLVRFLRAAGTPVEELGDQLLGDLAGLAPALRRARQPWDTPVPVHHVGVVLGAGHEVQAVADDSNAVLRDLWRDIGSRATCQGSSPLACAATAWLLPRLSH